MEQPVWDDVEEGVELLSLVKNPTTRQLVKYCASSGDYYEIHYDKDFAQSQGLPGPIIHGALKNAFLAQLVTQWMGPWGALKRLGCLYRAMDQPGRLLYCKGRVARKYHEGGQHLVDCEVWIENSEGQRTTHGWATVVLPTRDQAALWQSSHPSP